jgi:hypothetical protein
MNEEMNVNDLANMLCASINAEMKIALHHDKIEVSGGTALGIVDIYIVMLALEVVASRVLPIFTSADGLKESLKRVIDQMDFAGATEIKEETP